MIDSESLWRELKTAQLSLVNETDINTEIEYTWEFMPEKLTPGHRQRGKERLELYCLPFKIRRGESFVYSHRQGEEFVNIPPTRSPKLDEMLLEIAKIFISKKMKWGHVQENTEEVLHDALLFLYTKCCCVNLNKVQNPVPVLLFWVGNHFNNMTKWYFPTARLSIDEVGNIN